jgi:hypothetical protein
VLKLFGQRPQGCDRHYRPRRLECEPRGGITQPFCGALAPARPSISPIVKTRARRHRSRRLHLRPRSAPKTHAVHPPVQQGSQNYKVALPRPDTSHHSRFTRYSPLVPIFVRRCSPLPYVPSPVFLLFAAFNRSALRCSSDCGDGLSGLRQAVNSETLNISDCGKRPTGLHSLTRCWWATRLSIVCRS